MGRVPLFTEKIAENYATQKKHTPSVGIETGPLNNYANTSKTIN
ncbi:MAG: hypothetical protein ACK518_02780 [bacterium]|jgi:hypothetical protein